MPVDDVDAQANKLLKLTASDRNAPSARPWLNTTGLVVLIAALAFTDAAAAEHRYVGQTCCHDYSAAAVGRAHP